VDAVCSAKYNNSGLSLGGKGSTHKANPNHIDDVMYVLQKTYQLLQGLQGTLNFLGLD
jgi:hypothetical protein